MKKLLLAAAAATVFATPAFAAPGDTANADGTATATVIAPISITHDAGAALAFGTIITGTAAGTVTVTTAGSASAGGDAKLAAGSTNSADAFTVDGQANRTFTISATDGTVDGTSGDALTNGASMSFTTDVAASGTLNASGTTAVAVGGELSVGANQDAGDYEGTYNVTVAYN